VSNKVTAWRDKGLPSSEVAPYRQLGGKRSPSQTLRMQSRADFVPMSTRAAPGDFAISLSNHATCSWQLITRKMKLGDTVRKIHRRGRGLRGGRGVRPRALQSTIPRRPSRGRMSTSYAQVGMYPLSKSYFNAPPTLGGIANKWLSLLLWSRSETSFSGAGRRSDRVGVRGSGCMVLDLQDCYITCRRIQDWCLPKPSAVVAVVEQQGARSRTREARMAGSRVRDTK